MKDSSFGKIPARKIKKYHCDDFIRIVINDFTYKWLMEQKRRTKQAGIESEYVIPANIGKMVKESSLTSTFKAFLQ